MPLDNKDEEVYIPEKINKEGIRYRKTSLGVDINPEDIEEELDYVSDLESELDGILDDIDLDELRIEESEDNVTASSIDKESRSTDKESLGNDYFTDNNLDKESDSNSFKGTKNYLPNERHDIETINIKAEVLESSSSLVRKGKSLQESSVGSEGKTKKRRNTALPYSDMFAYYVKGEKIMQGGMKKTTTPTYEDVALRFNCSEESVQKVGRKQQWFKKRKAYRDKLQGDFSFYGQMAADINGHVLANSNSLMKRIEAKINHPTFMPDPDSIVTTSDGKVHVEDNEGRLHLYSGNEGKLHETQILLNMTRSLELINKICNNTVQVEVDNLNLLQNQQINSGQKLSTDPETRMRQVEEIQERLSWGKTKKKGEGKLSKAEKVRRMQEGKEAKARSQAEKEILDS